MDSMSIYNWLRVINLQQYTSLFLKAGFSNSSQCVRLTEQDLGRIGVTLAGHVRRILAHPPKGGDGPNADTTISANVVPTEAEEVPMLPPKVQTTRSIDTLNQLSRVPSIKPTPKPRRTVAQRTLEHANSLAKPDSPTTDVSTQPDINVKNLPSNIAAAEGRLENSSSTLDKDATLDSTLGKPQILSLKPKKPSRSRLMTAASSSFNDHTYGSVMVKESVAASADKAGTGGNTYHEYENDDEFKEMNHILKMSDSDSDVKFLDIENRTQACSNDYHDYINELEVMRSLDQGFSSSSDSASQHQLSPPGDTNAEPKLEIELDARSPEDGSYVYESVWEMHSTSHADTIATNIPVTTQQATLDLTYHNQIATGDTFSTATSDSSRDSYYLPPPTFAPPPLPSATDTLPVLPPRKHVSSSTHSASPLGLTTISDNDHISHASKTQTSANGQVTPRSINKVTTPVMGKSMFDSCSGENPFANADPFTDFTTECSQFNDYSTTLTTNLFGGDSFDDILGKYLHKDIPLSDISMTDSMDVVKCFDPLAQATSANDTDSTVDDDFDPFDLRQSKTNQTDTPNNDNAGVYTHNTPYKYSATDSLVDLDTSECVDPHTDSAAEAVYYNDQSNVTTDDIYENSEYIGDQSSFETRSGSQRSRDEKEAHRKTDLTVIPPSPLRYHDDGASDVSTKLETIAWGKRLSSAVACRIPIVPGAASARHKDRSGYLFKQGGFQGNKGWRKRWVVFNGEDLRYYAENKSYVSKRLIPLSNIENVEADIKVDDHKRFKFKVISKTRVYIFSSDTLTDNQMWTQTLMEAIISYRRNNPRGEAVEGGKMNKPDIEGYVKFDGKNNWSYMVIKRDILCYYRTKEDFDIACPIHEIPMKLAGVKQLSKNRLQLSTHYQHFYLTFETPRDMMRFKMAMEESIAEGLADDTVLCQVRVIDSNHLCADCRASDPHWAAINYGIVLCTRCAGIHRMFTQSRIRSLRMDTKVWTTNLVTIMFTIGNGNANGLLEFDMTGDHEIDPDCPEKVRQQHLETKYKHRRYLKPHELTSDRTALNEALLQSAQTGDVLSTLHLILCGAEVMYHRTISDTRTAYDLAKEAGQVLQMELISHNGGDGSMKIRHSMLQEVKVRMSVALQGYVYKSVSSNFKGLSALPAGITNIITPASELQRRWLVLEHGILSSFIDEKSGAAKDMLDCDKFVAIFAAESERHEFSFQVSSINSSKLIVFAAELPIERITWMQALAKSFCPIPLMEQVGACEFSLAGFFHVRDGLTEWIMSWLMLTGKHLAVYREELEDFDMRKIQNLATQESDTCENVRETGSCVAVVFSGRTLYIQADLQRDTDSFLQLIHDASSGSSGSLEDQQLTNKNIPVIVEKCISYIDIHGKTTEGIYRRSGTHSKITQLLESFKADAKSVGILTENYTEHDVANVLKRYFRSLDDPLLTRSLYDDWIEKAAFSDHNTKLQWYKYLLCQLPKINYDTLKRIIGHISSISDHQDENLMGVSQLASIFGPALMTLDTDEVVQNSMMAGNTGREITVLTDIIHSHQWLFEVDETEAEKDRQIDDAAKKLRVLVERNESLSQVALVTMIDVHVNNRDGECITLKQVGHDTTVAQVLKWVCSKANLQESSCAIYEVACADCLERPLVSHALIQDIIGEWQNWPEDDRRGVYLCVRSGDVVQIIHSLYDCHAPLFGELKFSEKKSYKKCCVEFQQYKLACYKDSRATHKIGEWEIERVSVYSGVEKKRNPPTEYGFTFIIKGEKMKRNRDTPHFGKSICCSSQEEAMNWLSGIYKAQFPNGFHNA